MLNPREPLWLPRGSVRALLAIGLIAASIYGFMAGVIGADVFMPLATAVVVYYFAQRPSTTS